MSLDSECKKIKMDILKDMTKMSSLSLYYQEIFLSNMILMAIELKKMKMAKYTNTTVKVISLCKMKTER